MAVVLMHFSHKQIMRFDASMESLINTGRSESFVDLNETDLALSRSVLNQGRDMFMSYQGMVFLEKSLFFNGSSDDVPGKIGNRIDSTCFLISFQVMVLRVKAWMMNQLVAHRNSMDLVSLRVYPLQVLFDFFLVQPSVETIKRLWFVFQLVIVFRFCLLSGIQIDCFCLFLFVKSVCPKLRKCFMRCDKIPQFGLEFFKMVNGVGHSLKHLPELQRKFCKMNLFTRKKYGCGRSCDRSHEMCF